jgi:hypothetical protein
VEGRFGSLGWEASSEAKIQPNSKRHVTISSIRVLAHCYGDGGKELERLKFYGIFSDKECSPYVVSINLLLCVKIRANMVPTIKKEVPAIW